MKRFLTLLLITGFAMVASSCKKEYITEVVQPNRTIFYNIDANDWVLKSDGVTWTVALDDLPELDSYNHGYAGVLVYLMIENGVYEQIPEVYYGISYSYSYQVGRIDIDAQEYDAAVEPSRPPGSRVKIVLIDSVE